MKSRRLLVINRGAIAAHIRDVALKLGLEVHLVYEDGDQSHLLAGVNAHFISSYKDEDMLLALIQQHAISWVHPGYGFLAESASFASKVIHLGCGWIGPKPSVIGDFEDKLVTKQRGAALNIPVLSTTTSEQEAATWSGPIMVKAKRGGGGRGMRLVTEPALLADTARLVASEALQCFASDEVYFEPYIKAARHIEVQLLGDQQGQVMVIGDRDCSIQRRHQKVIEMAPALGLSTTEREAIHADAKRLGLAAGLTSCATVEFLFDVTLRQHWLIEVNPRIQVEHGVTDQVMQLSLVEWQLRVALGEALPEIFKTLKPQGYAIQARIYAEDPADGFQLSFGELDHLKLNTATTELLWRPNCAEGDVIDGRFDPMLMKVIAHGFDPTAAQIKLLTGLRGAHFAGIRTNRDALIHWLEQLNWTDLPQTDWLQHRTSPVHTESLLLAQIALVFLEANLERTQLFEALPHGWRIQGSIWQHATHVFAHIDQIPLQYRWLTKACLLTQCGREVTCVHISSQSITLKMAHRLHTLQWVKLKRGLWSIATGTMTYVTAQRMIATDFQEQEITGQHMITATLPGRVVACYKTQGESVCAGEVIMMIEAMKMHHEIKAPQDGVIVTLNVAVNDQVRQNQCLLAWEDCHVSA